MPSGPQRCIGGAVRVSWLVVLAGACSGDLPTEQQFAPLPDVVARGVTVALTNVHVVPMDAPRVDRHQTVIVREGRIATVGPASDVEVPPDAEVLDGDGRYLMPGLADMHVHVLHAEDLLLYVANGVTTIRNMWGTTAILGWRDAVARGDLLGPRIYSASRGLDGSPPVWQTTIVVEGAAEAAQAVEREAALGFDFIKVYNSLDPHVYDAIMSRAASLGIPVVGHVPIAVGLDHALARGQATTEHLARYPVGLDGDALTAFARAHAATDTRVSPTLIVRISFVNASDAADLEARDAMRFVHPEDRARWAPVAGAAPREVQRSGSRERGRLLRALVDAGAGILLGTDAWISYVIPGFAVHDELTLLVEDARLTPYEALRAGTAHAAQAVGAGAEWGTIAPGRAADLILLRANPLEDVAYVRERSGVMVAGMWLSEAELRRRLEALADGYAGGGGGVVVDP